jgi:hypothetical protein
MLRAASMCSFGDYRRKEGIACVRMLAESDAFLHSLGRESGGYSEMEADV